MAGNVLEGQDSIVGHRRDAGSGEQVPNASDRQRIVLRGTIYWRMPFQSKEWSRMVPKVAWEWFRPLRS